MRQFVPNGILANIKSIPWPFDPALPSVLEQCDLFEQVLQHQGIDLATGECDEGDSSRSLIFRKGRLKLGLLLDLNECITYLEVRVKDSQQDYSDSIVSIDCNGHGEPTEITCWQPKPKPDPVNLWLWEFLTTNIPDVAPMVENKNRSHKLQQLQVITYAMKMVEAFTTYDPKIESNTA